MPHTRFQLVFGPDDTCDLQILIDDELRHTHLDLRDASFTQAMLAEPEVQEAPKAWMLGARAPAWMSLADLEDALEAAGLDFQGLGIKLPVERAA